MVIRLIPTLLEVIISYALIVKEPYVVAKFGWCLSSQWGCLYLADYRSRIGGSRQYTQDKLYFKHLRKRVNCSYTNNKL